MPPVYRAALEYLTPGTFTSGRSALLEDSFQFALGKRPGDNRTWASFPHATTGISRITSRVNYIVHRDSPLAQRRRLSSRCLRYRDLVDRLTNIAGCRWARSGKGGHDIWRSPAGRTFPVPRHPGDLRKGTLAKIIKEAGLTLSVSEFIAAKP